MLHQTNPDQLPQVCYFYLPSLNDKPAEVIGVVNCTSDTIRIPMPEEDLELSAFFQRNITPTEYEAFSNQSTWRIFSSWSELETDHQKYKVNLATMLILLSYQQDKPLQEHLAVA
ncbi:hypothetical protein [Pontibacter fetidus]|uniref:Uncharacterized protein n=1 Tax=Pontibacter fetidus TaxID=2700082 RepID=A0A6B2H6C0_9BACT|nr:hypothetical protein [Pontibacter fetidus]NDK57728.1 hypothetical protein [Pontibacter fetidus]